jgi:AbrB family looped-hinge helix DNA binding protein
MAKSLNTIVTSKGQITIPWEIRNKMQLSSGSKLEFFYKDDYIIILPINKSLKQLKGILPKPKKALSCEEINEIVRSR